MPAVVVSACNAALGNIGQPGEGESGLTSLPLRGPALGFELNTPSLCLHPTLLCALCSRLRLPPGQVPSSPTPLSLMSHPRELRFDRTLEGNGADPILSYNEEPDLYFT